MNAALADYRLVWRTAVAPSMLRRAVWGVLALSIAGVSVFAADPRTPTLLIGLPALSLILMYWMEFAPGAVRQLTPANAQLVPRLRRRAMQAVAAYWLAAVIVVAIGAGNAFGQPVLWALGAGLWLMGSAMSRAGLRSGVEMLLVPLMLTFLPAGAKAVIFAFAATWAGAAAGAVLLGAAAWYGMANMFPKGDRHFEQRTALADGLARAIGVKDDADIPSGRAARDSWYARSLRRATRGSTGGGELLLHALGPAAHWTNSAIVTLNLLGIGLAVALWLRLTATDDMLASLAVVGSVVMLPLVFLFAASPQAVVRRFAVTAGEQALVRLSPAAPDSRDLNRVLLRELVRRALVDWLMVAAALVTLTATFGGSAGIVMVQAAICCMGLPCICIVLRDYARGTAGALAYIAPVLAIGGAVAGWIIAWLASPAVAAAVLLAATVPLVALTVGWSAHRMLRAPAALPAGRLAR